MPDTDFAVELFRVTPSGGMYRLTGSIQRLRYRDGYDQDSRLEPGHVDKLVVDCPSIGCRFQPGDRVHLQIGSAAVPAYAPHLNTLDQIASATKPVIASSRVWHSTGRRSSVALSIRSEAIREGQDWFAPQSTREDAQRSPSTESEDGPIQTPSDKHWDGDTSGQERSGDMRRCGPCQLLQPQRERQPRGKKANGAVNG